MKFPYCLPIIKNSKSGVLEAIKTNDKDYRYFEVWLDYVDGVDEKFIKRLVDLLGERLILLFRRQNLEAIKMPLEQRYEILKQLDNSLAWVDLDVTTQAAELDFIRDHGLKIKTVVSYHDYSGTPDTVRLEKITDIMSRYRPGIYKLATLCKSHEDALRLLKHLLKLKADGKAAIVLGMGEMGLVTRVFGTLWGNGMTFAPVDSAEQSAPGQLTRRQLENIFKELEA